MLARFTSGGSIAAPSCSCVVRGSYHAMSINVWALPFRTDLMEIVKEMSISGEDLRVHLAVQCLIAMKSWDECLTLLGSVEREHESLMNSQDDDTGAAERHINNDVTEKGGKEVKLPEGQCAKVRRADGSIGGQTYGIKLEVCEESTDVASISTISSLCFLRGRYIVRLKIVHLRNIGTNLRCCLIHFALRLFMR